MSRKLLCGLMAGCALTMASALAQDDADTLRSELDALTQRLDAMEKSDESAQSGWESKVKVKGDVRYRFQHVQAEDADGSNLSTTKNIQRIRARIGVEAEVNDFTTAGLELRTGSKANSGNVTLGDHFDGFDMSFSLAYFTLAPADAKFGSATFGKMKQPWKNTTDLIWDSDVNPEGVAYSYANDYDALSAFASAGYFRVEEENLTTDLNLASGQLGVALPLGEKVKLTTGGSVYGYENAMDFADPVLPDNYATDYFIAEGFAEAGFKDIGPIPFKLYANYVNNTEADDDNDGFCAGIKLGDTKKGKWEAKYDYRDLGLYAAPAYFTDSDFADGGTGVKGHRIKGQYNFAKNLAGGLTYIRSQRTPDRSLDQDQQFNTLMLDLMVKF